MLVCCTGGEEGDILNPAMDRPEVRADIAAVRRGELEAAAAIIGYDEVVMLGYRDSGMPDSEANADPRSFAQAPLDEAVGRLVAVIRGVRPQVIVTYPDDQEGYPHPDHLRVHEITFPAFDAAADPSAYPGAGAPVDGGEALLLRLVAAADRGRCTRSSSSSASSRPFDEKWFDRPAHDEKITARVDTSMVADVRRRALLAHATQVDPTSKFWFGLPPEVADSVYPVDDYQLGRSAMPTSAREDDLFAGIRAHPEQATGT